MTQYHYDGPGRLVSRHAARDIVRNYLCTNCWGHLTEYFGHDIPEGMSVVRCSTEGCDCDGFVSAHWVEREESRQAETAAVIRNALQGAGILPATQKQSPDEILRELGY